MQGCMSDITQTSHCHWCRSLDAGLSYWFALFVHNSIIPDMVGFSPYPSTRISWFTVPCLEVLNSLFSLEVHLHTSSFMKRVYSDTSEAIPKHPPLPRYYTSQRPTWRTPVSWRWFWCLLHPVSWRWFWCLLQNSAMGVLPLEKVLQLSSRMNDGFFGTKVKILCGVSKQQQKQQKTPQKPTLLLPKP